MIKTPKQEVLTIDFAPYGIDALSGKAHMPHLTQKLVLEWVDKVRAGQHGKPGIPVLYLQHGVASGGTRAILAPVVECLFAYPGLRCLIGRKDYQDLRLSVMETFFEVMPRILVMERDEQEHRYVIRGTSGDATVFFRELKDVSGLGSQEFAIIVVSEAHEIDLTAYRTLKQRCRQAGYPLMLLMEGNPPSMGHWLGKLTDKNDPEFDQDIDRMTLSSYENWNFMSPSYRNSLEGMPHAWRRRYLLGETAALPSGTAVYPAFVDTVHVMNTKVLNDRPILRSWDFGLRRAACCWSQLTDDGRLMVHNEWLPMETPEEQFIDGVLMRTNMWFGQRPCRDFGDPAARNRDPHGVNTLTRLQKKGIQLQWRQTTYGERIPLINQRLSQMVNGKPAIQIDPKCSALIEGLMGGYHYPELKPDQEFSLKKDEPYRDGFFEHICNAWEYLCVNLFGRASPTVATYIRKRNDRMKQMSLTQGAAVF